MRTARSATRALLLSIATASSIAMAPGSTPASDAAAGNIYYVAPNGNDGAAGTQAAPWASIARAQAVTKAGDTVYLRGGTYAYTRANSACSSQTARVDAITLNKSGSSGNPIRYWAHPGEKPVFDFSRMTDNCRIKGFNVTGSWIHLKGLEVTGVPQNNNRNAESWGIWVSGSNNVFEQIDTHHHMGTGLFISGGGGNLVLDSDAHDNYDPRSSDGPGENADGFGSHYTPAGRAANVFRGCRAWWNADDGFDLISTYSPVVIENSWAWRNGYVPGTTTPSGNGAGFKAGGYGGDYDASAVKHTVRSSVAFLNKAAGFYANHHPVANDFFNNTGYGNHPNFNMLGIDSRGAAVGRGQPAQQHRPHRNADGEHGRHERRVQLLEPRHPPVELPVPGCVHIRLGRAPPDRREPARAAPPPSGDEQCPDRPGHRRGTALQRKCAGSRRLRERWKVTP